MTINPLALLWFYRRARTWGYTPKYARLSAYMHACVSRADLKTHLDRNNHYWMNR